MEDRGWWGGRMLGLTILSPRCSILVSRQFARRRHEPHHALAREPLVPLQVLQRDGVCLVGVAIPRRVADGGGAEDRGAHEADAAGAQVGEADGWDAFLVSRLLGRRPDDLSAAEG